MKGRGLKIWQAILLVFSSVCVVSGGVVLYTYLTNGFGDKQIKPDSINFVLDDNKFNSTNNQFEVEGDFSLTINSPTEGVTEKEISLSFAKTLSSQTVVNSTEIIGGVQYISNGVIAVPSTVTLGEPFTVLVEQKQYTDAGNYVSNVGGITTLKARSKNLLDSVGSTVNIAVDVPIEKIDLEIKDTSTGKKYEIHDSVAEVFQNINFEINAKYFPATSGYRYSDNLFKQFYNITEVIGEDGEVTNPFVERRKDFCYDVVSGQNVVMNFNEGDIYFTSSMIFSNNNKVEVYAFKNASKQDEFEATNPEGEAEVVYNSKLKFLHESQSGVQKANVTIEIVQADVADYAIAYNTFDTMKTNRLFTLTANNQNQGDATLGLTISDSEGVSVSSMISQIGLKISYKTPGMESYVMLGNDPAAPLVVKSLDKVVIGDQEKDNPYKFPESGDDYYFIINSSVKNLNNAYWEFSTSEETMSIKIEVVLFKTEANEDGDYETRIFKNELPTATISVSAGEDNDVMWLGNTTENLSIVFRGENKIPSQLSLAEKTDIPAQNTYKTVYYLVRKEGVEISTDDVNIDPAKTKSLFNPESSIDDGYCVAESNELLFKTAGEYSIIFVTIKTDAYGKPIFTQVPKLDEHGMPKIDGDGEPVMENRYEIIKKSAELTVIVKETLQGFQETSFEFGGDFGVGAYQEITDVSEITQKDGNVIGNYYTQEGDDYTPVADANKNALLKNFANTYYPLYYALQTGTNVTLKITVAESDTTKLETEYDAHLVNFYAISARTNEDGTPAYKYKLEVEDTPDYDGQKATFTLKLPNDRITEFEESEGEGLGFYLAIGYDNSIEEVMTEVGTFDGRKRVVNGKNCFMLYTPIACTITNPILNDSRYKAEIAMNEYAEYENCTITNKDDAGEIYVYDAVSGKSGKVKFNEEIAKTIVKDFYNNEMDNAFSVQVEQGAQTIYVVDEAGVDKLEFNSGKEYGVVVTLYANEKCSLSFTMDVESNGLYEVTIDSNPFFTFANVNATKNGAAEETTTLRDSVKLYVGTETDIEDLDPTKYFFYLDDITDANLLNMFDFYNDAATPLKIATGDLNTTTPISKFTTKQDFAQGKALVFKVSNKNYSDPTDTSVETINLKVTYNFTSNINAVINIQDTDLVGENKVYAGKDYTLDSLISLSKISGVSLSWNTPFNLTHYIRQDGTVVEESAGQQTEDLGQIVGGKITFYDVAQTKTVTVKLFYYGNNPYAFNCEAEFTLCPNLKIERFVDEDGNSIDLDIVELANLGTTGLNIGQYLKINRISGSKAISNVKPVILANGYPVVINATGTNFVFDSTSVFRFQYNEYSKDMPIGIKLGSADVCDANGNQVVYNETKAIIDKGIFFGGTGDHIISAGSEEILYNGIDTLKVIPGTDYVLETGQIGGGAGKENTLCKFEPLPAGRHYSFLSGDIVKFANQTTKDGILFGETYYMLIAVQANKGANNIKVAEVKVPLLISTVGSKFVQYGMANSKIDFNSLISGNKDFYALATDIKEDVNGYYLKNGASLYNENAKLQITLSEKTYLESASEETFEIGGVNYRLVRTYVTMPYANYTAGTCTRFTFKEGTGATDNAVVYDDGTAVEVKFANGLTETTSKYGTIIKDGTGEYWLQLKNIAGEPVYQTIIVTFSKEGKSFEFEYRIRIAPNTETNAIYPFSEGENSAEYVSVSSNATYDFAQNFGSYAGAKSDNTRFNLDLDTTASKQIYDDSKEYYVNGVVTQDSISGKYVLPIDTTLYDAAGNAVFTLTKAIVLESYDSTATEIGGTDYHKVRVSSAEYKINKIVVGSNGELITGSVEFAALTNGTETKYITSTNYYRLNISSITDGKRFELYYNNDIIMDATFTKDGLLTMNSVESSHFVNFYVQKEYTNIVEGALEYKFFMNDTNGRNYIEYSYKDAADNLVTLPSETLTEVEDLIKAGSGTKTYSLLTKYTTSSGTQIADLEELNVSVGLKDRNGNAVADLTKAINVSDPAKVIGEVDSGIELAEAVGSGKYTLNVSVKGDVDQNYTLEIFFMTSTKMISTLIIHITPIFELPNIIPTFTAGSTIDATLINNTYHPLPSISSIEYDTESSRQVPYVNGYLKIADLKEDVQGVVLDVKINNMYYLPITFNIEKNITPKASYTLGTPYYAGEMESVSLSNFYTGGTPSTFDASATIPLSFRNYVDETQTKVAGSQFNFVSKDVETEVRGVRVILNFAYNFTGLNGGKVEYSFDSNFVVNILPNVAYTVTYPQPDETKAELESESVYFDTEYANFFGGTAPFADQKRLVVAKAKDATEYSKAELGAAKIRMKNVNGAVAYFNIGTFADLPAFSAAYKEGYFYIHNGTNFVREDGFIDATTTYYIRIAQGKTAWEFTGLEQNITFGKYGNYADGSMTFEIEFNKVVCEYNVRCYEDIVNFDIVNSTNSIDGKEEIFIEQLEEGNVLAENAVAKLNMGTAGSGVYYIKVARNDNVNPYSWVGFNYDDSTDENIVYVFLGASCHLDMNVVEGKAEIQPKDILGIFDSKESNAINYLKNKSIDMELTSFVNMTYRTMQNGKLTLVPITNAEEKITILDAIRNNAEISSFDEVVYKIGDKYYKRNGDELTGARTGTKKYAGTYDVYDGYVKGTDIFLSARVEPVSGDITLGRKLKKEATNFIDANAGEKELYSFGEGADKAYVVKEGTNVQSRLKLKAGETMTLYEFDNTPITLRLDNETLEIAATNENHVVVKDKTDVNYYLVPNNQIKGKGDSYEVVTFNGEHTIASSGTQISEFPTVSIFGVPCLQVEIEGTGYYVWCTDQSEINETSLTTGEGEGAVTTYTYTINLTEKIVLATSGTYYEGITLDELSDQKYEKDGKTYFAPVTTMYLDNSVAEGVCTYKPTTDIYPTYFTTQVYSDVDYFKEYKKYIFSNSTCSTQVTGNGKKYLCKEGLTSKIETVYYLAETDNTKVYRPFSNNVTMSPKEEGDLTHLTGAAKDYVRFTEDSKKYFVKYGDLRTTALTVGGTTYYSYDINTFSITQIKNLAENDEVEVTILYAVDEQMKTKTFNFKLKIDVEMRNSIFSDNTTAQAEQLVDSSSAMVEIGGKKVNYLEVEANKEYDFNTLVGLYKKSTQNQMTNLDFNNKHTIDVSVVSKNDPLFASGEFATLKTALGKELKDNASNIRMSWELVKTSSSAHGVVYNFTLTPLGADNNGDFVLMKYSYKSQVKDFANFGSALDYEKTEYVLFKIVSDYVVTIRDVEGNSISVVSLASEKNNANSVVEITNNTFNPMQSQQLGNYFGGGTTGDRLFSDVGGAGTIKYKFGLGRKDEFSSGGDSFTAVTIQKAGADTTAETLYVQTVDINKGLIKNSAYLYSNMKIPVTSGQNQMVRITSKNSINPARDVSALLFDAELFGETTYIIDPPAGYKVDKGNGGLKMSSKDLYLGQKDLHVVLCDEYGYTVKFYFSLMASANPTYAAGALEYVEGDKFDLGARYQELQATNYVVESNFRYEILEDTVFVPADCNGNPSNKYKFTKYVSGSTDGYDYMKCEATSGLEAYRLITNMDMIETEKRYKKELNSSGAFYNLNNVNVTHTLGSVADLNMPYNFGTIKKTDSTETKDECTTLYLTESVYIEISTTYLQSINNAVFYRDTSITTTTLHTEKTYTFAAGGLTNNSYTKTDDGKGYVYNDTVGAEYYHYVLVDDGAAYDPGTEYFRILDKKTLTSTRNAYVSFNIPYGFGKIEGATQGTVGESTDHTTIYLPGANNYINVPNSYLKVSRLSVETKAPLEVVEGGTPDQAFKDIIEIDGINAYGFKDSYIQKAEDLPNQYLNPNCDIDYLTIESIKLHAGDNEIAKIAVTADKNDKLATTSKLYKYSSSPSGDPMGRDVVATEGAGSTLFTIPELPGWVYEEKDYAFVEMRIEIKHSRGTEDVGDDETYTLPLEIRVTKKADKIISSQSAATNVSDSAAFALNEHIKPDNGAEFAFIDDTLAVTLPGNGKVNIHVEAGHWCEINNVTSENFNEKIRYTFAEITGEESPDVTEKYKQVGLTYVRDDTTGTFKKVQAIEFDVDTTYYEKKTYSGDTSLASNYSDADYTYYVSLSRIVGRTLEEGFEVNVTFSDYDINTVTKEGHVGYFASYGYGTDIHKEVSGGSKISAKFDEAKSLVVNVPTDGRVTMKIVATKGTEGKTGYEKLESALIPIVTGTAYAAGDIYSLFDKELSTNYYLEFIFFDCGDGTTDGHTGFYATYGDKTAEGKARSINNTLKTQTQDILHLTDKGHLAGEKQYVTKYYIAKNTQGSGASEKYYYYQFVKNYNLYPAYIDFETQDNNNRITTTDIPSVDGEFYTFDLSTWGRQLFMSHYDNGSIKSTNLVDSGDINKFYFEVGEDDTTSAEIEADGTLKVKRDIYAGKLNGELYVTINVFLKAGGETGKFTTREVDKYNTRVISVKLYLRDETDIFARVEELESLAVQYKAVAPSVTYSARQLALMYVRASKYNDGQWNTLAGTLPESFVSYVEEHSNRYAQEFRIMDDFTPSETSGTLDFKHFMAVLNMYEDSTAPSMKLIIGDQSISDVGGWAGDLATLVKDVKNADGGTDLDKARNLLAGESSFGIADYISDLDASNIYNMYLKVYPTMKIGTAMSEYYLTDMFLREKNFLMNELGYNAEDLGSLTVEDLKAKIKTRFTDNRLIKGATIFGVAVEGLLTPISDYTSQIDACCQAFAEKLLSGISAS